MSDRQKRSAGSPAPRNVRQTKRRRVSSPQQTQTTRKRSRQTSTVPQTLVRPRVQNKPGKRQRLGPVPVSKKRSRQTTTNTSPAPPKKQRRVNTNNIFPHQRHVQTMVRRVIQTPQLRGGLVWHGTGTGKTVSSLAILIEYLRHQYERRPYLVVVSHRSNIKENGYGTYVRNIRKHFPSVNPSVLDSVHFMTYAKLANRLGLMRYQAKWSDWKTRGLVIIVDESHVLTDATKPRVQKQNDATALWNVKTWISSTFRNVSSGGPHHVYCLTATPGSTIQGFLRTMNVVRPRGIDAFTPESILTNPVVKQIVSYADIRNNYSIFPRIVDPNVRDVTTNLSFIHYLVLCLYIGKHISKTSVRNHVSCGELYLRKARAMEDIVYTSDSSRLLKGPVFTHLCGEYGSRTPSGSVPLVNTTSNRPVTSCQNSKMPLISPKIQQCLRNCATKPGKHLLYVSSHTLIPVIHAVLRQRYGFSDASRYASRGQSVPVAGNRFLSITKSNEQAKFASFFNDPGVDNTSGQAIKVLIVSGQNYMGLNVRGLRGIHATAPFVTSAGHTQFKGRGARAYGHINLPEPERTTSMYIYDASVTLPANASNSFHDSVQTYLESIGGKPLTKTTIDTVSKGYAWLVTEFKKATKNTRGLNMPMNGTGIYPLPSDITRFLQQSLAQKEFSRFIERFVSTVT